MEKKDKYIRLLQNAKSKADSINMVLAVSLKSELQQGIFDQDIQVSVDKTVVYIDLSDKMLFSSGSSKITPKAKEVLGKISTIIKGKTGFDVMVEGYTDSKSIKTACIDDNWDLSVKRATAVVRTLQNDYQVNGNRLIAAGRGEYKPVADNATSEGRTANRRTRIVILPQLDQFYELLNPVNIPK